MDATNRRTFLKWVSSLAAVGAIPTVVEAKLLSPPTPIPPVIPPTIPPHDAFLPEIRLFQHQSKLVHEGKIAAGRFGMLHKGEIIKDIGPQLTIKPTSWMESARAFLHDGPHLHFRGRDADPVVNPFIIELKAVADGSGWCQDYNCMYGPEFLTQVDGMWATYFAGCKSARAHLTPFRTAKVIGLDARLYQREMFQWYAPCVNYAECVQIIDFDEAVLPRPGRPYTAVFPNSETLILNSGEKLRDYRTQQAINGICDIRSDRLLSSVGVGVE